MAIWLSLKGLLSPTNYHQNTFTFPSERETASLEISWCIETGISLANTDSFVSSLSQDKIDRVASNTDKFQPQGPFPKPWNRENDVQSARINVKLCDTWRHRPPKQRTGTQPCRMPRTAIHLLTRENVGDAAAIRREACDDATTQDSVLKLRRQTDCPRYGEIQFAVLFFSHEVFPMVIQKSLSG